MLEAIGLCEKYGKRVLCTEDLLFVARAKKEIGCRCIRANLGSDDVKRIIGLGRDCLKWKERENGV